MSLSELTKKHLSMSPSELTKRSSEADRRQLFLAFPAAWRPFIAFPKTYARNFLTARPPQFGFELGLRPVGAGSFRAEERRLFRDSVRARFLHSTASDKTTIANHLIAKMTSTAGTNGPAPTGRRPHAKRTPGTVGEERERLWSTVAPVQSKPRSQTEP